MTPRVHRARHHAVPDGRLVYQRPTEAVARAAANTGPELPEAAAGARGLEVTRGHGHTPGLAPVRPVRGRPLDLVQAGLNKPHESLCQVDILLGGGSLVHVTPHVRRAVPDASGDQVVVSHGEDVHP